MIFSKAILLACFVFLAILFSVFPPKDTKAAFFSLFKKADAETENSDHNTQTMPLPDPSAKIVSTKVDKKNELSYEKKTDLDKGLLSPEVGPLGTSLEVSELPESDVISVYTVHKGDSIGKIAQMFNVSVNTIRWANNMKPKDDIKEGDVLVILPVTGVSYTVKKGDTVKSIAKKFGADVEEVGRFNGVDADSELAYGETIVVPDGEIQEAKKETTKKKETALPALARGKTKLIQKFTNDAGLGYFIRPVSGGTRTQGLHGKNGVDIGGKVGQSVYASASGTVILARTGGYNGGYGNYIIVSHSNGSQTLYAHLNAVYVSTGQSVSQGEAIGELGNSGNSTGPHLHFEVRGAKNPLGDNPKYGL